MKQLEKIAAFIYCKALAETHYFVGSVAFEEVEKYFNIKISRADFEAISNKIFEIYGHTLADINNNDEEYYFGEGVFSLNYFGDYCYNEQEEPEEDVDDFAIYHQTRRNGEEL